MVELMSFISFFFFFLIIYKKTKGRHVFNDEITKELGND